LPVVDGLAAEYSDRVDFVAPAWKSSFELTQERAAEVMPSGTIMWGLDAEEEVFGLYGVPYQPVTVLIAADKTVVESWDGLRAAEEIRESIEQLMALSG
jgi:hypothetical protein